MSELALQLIAENKKAKSSFLDLGSCGLTKIPEEIRELVWLESLSFANYWFEWDGEEWQRRESQNTGAINDGLLDIGPLAALSAMQTLNISGTQVSDLTPLAALSALKILDVSRTQVSDLAPLAELIALQTLNVSGIQVSDLAPLAELSSLKTLFSSRTQVSDLAPLSELIALQTLEVSGIQASDLAPLAELGALQTLEVSGTQVSDLAPLSALSALQTLNVSGTQVSDLAPLSALSALQTLYVSSTQVSDLAPLSALSALQNLEVSGIQVSDLAPLAELSSLQTLNVSGTQVSDLAPLAELSALQKLGVWDTQVSDLAPLAELGALKTLFASRTQVSDLAPLAALTELKTLNVPGTQVSDLAPLAELTALQRLSVWSTQVTDLSPLRTLISKVCPVLWDKYSWEPGIHVKGCPLINPPVEIVTQGNEAILNYFRERELGDVDHLYEAKMLILGEGSAGKTSLLRRLYQPELPLPTEDETTRGIEIHQHEFTMKNGRQFRLNVWDFGGQEIYHATHQFFLTRRSLYLLVDDTRKDHKSVSDEGFRYWLELIDLFGGHSPVLIFQNEKGGRSKAIDLAGIKGRYDNVMERYGGNLEQPNAARELEDGIEYFATHLSHIGDELPAYWIKVREDIESRAEEEAYITQQAYFDIYTRHMAFDRAKALHLSRYLHDLGVFLHFQDDPLLAKTVILQNKWATEAVFRILDDETIKAKFGRFDSDDCKRLWRDSKYADMHPELLAMMQRFELCYALPDSRPKTWLAPQLLPPTKPDALQGWDNSEDMVLRYRYDFMPKGIISRLTVRLHRYVREPELAWVSGVLFEQDDTQVLVEVLANGRDIELRARGVERKVLLSVVSADLDGLNHSFPGLHDKVDKWIPCHCKECRVSSPPEFFAQKKLLKRKKDNRLQVECPSSYEDVDVLELLDGIRMDELPGWAKEEPKAPQRVIKIFLASSSELKKDRDAFDLYFRQRNDQLIDKGVYLKIVRWEHFLDAISDTRLQDEYNKAVRDCDIFVSLFFTKTGKFTEEEFDTAHQQFKDSGSPKIYTFFKNAKVNTGDIDEEINSLLQFKKKLADLGHFTTGYDNIEHLKRQFRDQLDRLLEEVS